MTKELVSNWFNRLPDAEKDLPLLILDSIAYTPRTAYNEVMRNSPVGNRLQQLIETGSIGTSLSDEQAVAKTRLQQMLSNEPDIPKFATLPTGRVLTPSQLWQEIESGSTVGSQWVQNELNHMKRIASIR